MGAGDLGVKVTTFVENHLAPVSVAHLSVVALSFSTPTKLAPPSMTGVAMVRLFPIA